MSTYEYLYYLKHKDSYGNIVSKEQIEKIKKDCKDYIRSHDNYRQLLGEVA